MGVYEPSSNDGEWLCSPGPYLDRVKAMCAFDPRLRSRDPKAVQLGTKWPMDRIRVVGLQHDTTTDSFHSVGSWTTAKDLSAALESNNTFPEHRGNVILVEGFTPDLVSVLGTKYGIHPSFFVGQERARHTKSAWFLPSRNRTPPANGTSSAMLRYVEPLYFEKGLISYQLSCFDTGRKICTTKTKDGLSPVGLLRRKCSYWRTSHGSTGFTVIVLCDPPVKRARDRNMDAGTFWPVITKPYYGGYPSFLPEAAELSASTGPPQTSLLDDLQYYLEHHGERPSNIEPGLRTEFFVHKIVASHFVQEAAFCSSSLISRKWNLTRKSEMDTAALSQVEEAWSNVQALERRVVEACNDLDDIMMRLGIRFQEPDTSVCSGADAWTRVDVDYQYLRMKFSKLQARAEQLNAATTGLTGMAGNRQSQLQQKEAFREAQRTKALTLVGLVFIPLAYTATLFSMDDRYMPGADHFWVYFATAVPLIVAVVVSYLVLDRAYDERTWVRFRRIVETARVERAAFKAQEMDSEVFP